MFGTQRNFARLLTTLPIVHLFFSFSGRLSRGGWWLAAPATWIAVVSAYHFHDVPIFGDGKLKSLPSVWFWYLAAILVYSSLSLTTKRLKDRGWSNWFIFVCLLAFLVFLTTSAISHNLFKVLPKPGESAEKSELLRYIYTYFTALASTLVAFITSVFIFVDNAFMSGTSGQNRHGPDPQTSRLGSLPSNNRDRPSGAHLLRLVFKQSMLLGGAGALAAKSALSLDAANLFDQSGLYFAALLAAVVIFQAYRLRPAFVLMWGEAGHHEDPLLQRAAFVVSIVVCLCLGSALTWIVFSSISIDLLLVLARSTVGALGFAQSGWPVVVLAMLIGMTIWFVGFGRFARILAALYRPAWANQF